MSFGLSSGSLGLLLAASFITSIVSGILGLAGGVALLGVMTVVLPAPAVIPLHGMAQLFSNGSRTALLLKEVVWRYALIYLGPLTLGVLLGAWFGRGLEFGWLEPAIAGMLIVVIAFRRLAPRLRHPPLWSYAALGLFVGVLTLFVGATGPFMAPFFQRDDLEPKQIVGTMAIAQSWNHLLKAPAFLLLGFDFAPHLPLLGLLFLSSVAGSWVGRRALERVDKERFGRAVEVVLFGLAVFLLVRGLR